ncbi:alpha carbonic anhydrase 7-like [Neltuma alba]|uniref:alpha carbonic anhydrase 7-like n=1 Tax=Neltuma alba TaxID=207710 RepID=UPI0010A34F6A|nr:alpha carbonic anhydrase 7-like [Prosopis alba]
MKRQTRTFIPCLLMLATILLQYSASTKVDHEVEFSYIEGSAKGPSRWGDLKPEWATCKHGTIQSPIDLLSRRVKVVSAGSEGLNKAYKPAAASILNRGHDVTVNWEADAGSITINGTHFLLQGAHWHWPSEHLINGKRFDLELHMVHQFTQPDGTNKTAVVTVLYKLGRPDPFLSKLEEYIKAIGEEGEEKSLGVIDPSEIEVGRDHLYYRYIGSLTAPPCTEGVIWTISNKIRTFSRKQLNLLVNSVQYYAKRNARPLQPLNNREVQFYVPSYRY